MGTDRRRIAGKYQLLCQVGQGGMGTVFEALHLATGRRVALKIMSDGPASSDPTSVARFQREARMVGAIESRHVVQVLDAGFDEESPPRGPPHGQQPDRRHLHGARARNSGDRAVGPRNDRRHRPKGVGDPASDRFASVAELRMALEPYLARGSTRSRRPLSPAVWTEQHDGYLES